MPYAKGLLISAGSIILSNTAAANTNCETALGLIAKSAVLDTIAKKQDQVCSGLKSGAIGVDKTKALELREFQFCEDGLVVTASLAIFLKCGSSDQAVFEVNVEDVLKATAKVDLEACKVLQANVAADSFLGKVGLSSANANQKFSDETDKAVKPYCKK